MNTTPTTRSYSKDSSSATRKTRFGRLLVVGILMCAVIACISNLSRSETPTAVESVFAEAVRPSPARLKSAREAAKRGDHELAIHDYLASIQEDVSTAESAIGEMVKVFLSVAGAHGAEERYVDQSAQINRCYQVLVQLKQADSTTRALPEPARRKLFEEIARVRSAGKKAAKFHIDTADQLRREAKGFWNDDEDKQADALHRVNLAWSYYPAHTDDKLVDQMYTIWADMKSELPTWQYNQVMERDRLRLGRVVGDR